MKSDHLREEWGIPVRGRIVDRNHVLLGTSLPLQTVAMDPYKVRSLSEIRRQKMFETLEGILGVSFVTLEKLSNRRIAAVPVKRGVDTDTESIIREYVTKGVLPGIQTISEQIRKYPWEDDTGAILGVVRGSRDILLNFLKANSSLPSREIRKKFPWYPYASISGATPQRGVGGIEQALDPWLSGSVDRYLCHLDRDQNPMQIFKERIERGRAPCSVVLTLDIHLQRFVSRLIRNKVKEKEAMLGMAVAIKAHSGEILAAYSASFDTGRLFTNDSRVFTSSFEAGSVAKPLMMLYAFTLGVIDENDLFNCNQPVRIGDKTYVDEQEYTHDLSPKDILTVSSDSGMAQIVKRIIQDRGSRLAVDTVNFFRECGLGKNISMTHTAICRSTLPSPARWSSITPVQIATGYEFKVSPFHLVSLYCGFANAGKIPAPVLVKSVVDESGKSVRGFQQDQPLNPRFPPNFASMIYDYLKSVVSAKGGTGRKAAIDGVEIAGKTGTARRLVNGKYSRRSHNSTFMGILPIEENSPLVIGVFFQDIKKGNDYGGAACAPVFREICEYIIEQGIGKD
jgi:cell division protein FtsI/penicillin-binding protein 2